MKMEKTKCSERSAYKIQTPGKYPEEIIQHSEHGESWKSGESVLDFVEELRVFVSTKRTKGRWGTFSLLSNCILATLFWCLLCLELEFDH